MTSPEPPHPVHDEELLARFILFSGWFWKGQTVRPDCFIPHPYPDLSVTRHFGLSESQLWRIGQETANARPKATLYGRADLKTVDARRQKLQVTAAPLRKNLNHANITGWPPDKPSQKVIAQELAASATFVART
jgi:hypothetical protein